MNDNGKSKATASLVLGIISVVLCWLGLGAISAVITGVFGIIMSSQSKKEMAESGNFDNRLMATFGLVLSIVGISIGAVVFLISVLVVGTIGFFGWIFSAF